MVVSGDGAAGGDGVVIAVWRHHRWRHRCIEADSDAGMAMVMVVVAY